MIYLIDNIFLIPDNGSAVHWEMKMIGHGLLPFREEDAPYHFPSVGKRGIKFVILSIKV
jgi:hypothetical protein